MTLCYNTKNNSCSVCSQIVQSYSNYLILRKPSSQSTYIIINNNYFTTNQKEQLTCTNWLAHNIHDNSTHDCTQYTFLYNKETNWYISIQNCVLLWYNTNNALNMNSNMSNFARHLNVYGMKLKRLVRERQQLDMQWRHHPNCQILCLLRWCHLDADSLTNVSNLLTFCL